MVVDGQARSLIHRLAFAVFLNSVALFTLTVAVVILAVRS